MRNELDGKDTSFFYIAIQKIIYSSSARINSTNAGIFSTNGAVFSTKG